MYIYRERGRRGAHVSAWTIPCRRWCDAWRGCVCGWPNFCKTAGAADPPPVRGILVAALVVVVVVVGSIDVRFPSTLFIAQAHGKSVAFPDATALCRGVAAGERENPFVSCVSAAVNVNTTKAHESTSPRLRLTRHSSTGGTRGTWPLASRVTSLSPIVSRQYFLTNFRHTLHLSLSFFLSLPSFFYIFFNTFRYIRVPTSVHRCIASGTAFMCIVSGR